MIILILVGYALALDLRGLARSFRELGLRGSSGVGVEFD